TNNKCSTATRTSAPKNENVVEAFDSDKEVGRIDQDQENTGKGTAHCDDGDRKVARDMNIFGGTSSSSSSGVAAYNERHQQVNLSKISALQDDSLVRSDPDDELMQELGLGQLNTVAVGGGVDNQHIRISEKVAGG
ncbi:unnamed protein product, partial [Amoebophrya sp. A25]